MLTIVSIKYLTYTYFPATSFSKDILEKIWNCCSNCLLSAQIRLFENYYLRNLDWRLN